VAIIRRGRIIYEGSLEDLLAGAASGYRLRTPEPERARTLLLAQRGVEGLVANNGELRFSADERAAGALSIALGQARIPITALIPETASLEELFLEMTGEPSDEVAA
jgi:ABC-2 type transport system ATP-binding protein